MPRSTRRTSAGSPTRCAASPHRTQFIVITHNRGTIEAADALYGVTVGDDSVSRVISLRLDEAQALAARDRDRTALAGVGFAACPSGDAVTTKPTPEREVDEPVEPDVVDPIVGARSRRLRGRRRPIDAPTAPDEPEPTAERVDPLLPFDPPPPTVVTIEMPTPSRRGPAAPAWAEPVRRPNRRSLPRSGAAPRSRARRHRGRPRRRPRADPRRLHVAAARRPRRRPGPRARRGTTSRRR